MLARRRGTVERNKSAERLGNNPQRATGTSPQQGTIPNKRGGGQPRPGDRSESAKISGPLSAFIALLGTGTPQARTSGEPARKWRAGSRYAGRPGFDQTTRSLSKLPHGGAAVFGAQDQKKRY